MTLFWHIKLIQIIVFFFIFLFKNNSCFTAGKQIEFWNCHATCGHQKSTVFTSVAYGNNRSRAIFSTARALDFPLSSLISSTAVGLNLWRHFLLAGWNVHGNMPSICNVYGRYRRAILLVSRRRDKTSWDIRRTRVRFSKQSCILL